MKFQDLNLNTSLLNALADNGFEEPTAIQRKVFSPIMSGGDVIGIAQTGTGKTFAYLLPILRLWRFSNSKSTMLLGGSTNFNIGNGLGCLANCFFTFSK